MNLFDQILLKLYSFLVLLLSVILLLFGFGLLGTAFQGYLALLFQQGNARLVLAVFAIFLLLASLRFLLLGQRRGTVPPTINIQNQMGEMRISLTTLENIASKVLQRLPGIREWKVRVKPSEIDGNQFYIKIVADGEIPIPQLIEQIQQQVKAAVEELTGLDIQKVSVLVSDVAHTEAPRTRRVE